MCHPGHLCSVSIMKRFLQDTGAVPSSEKQTKHIYVYTASGSYACWEHFKDVERKARASYWYLATCSFCPERLRMRQKLKMGRARAHLGCITGQHVRICSRVPPEIRDQLVLSAYCRRHIASPRQLQKSEREKPHSGETNQHAPTQTLCNQPAIAVLTHAQNQHRLGTLYTYMHTVKHGCVRTRIRWGLPQADSTSAYYCTSSGNMSGQDTCCSSQACVHH